MLGQGSPHYILEINQRVQTSTKHQLWCTWSDLTIIADFIFMKISWDKEVSITFWKTLVECRPLAVSKGYNISLNRIVTTNHIFMKIVQDIDLGARKSPFHFGNQPESADLHQGCQIGLQVADGATFYACFHYFCLEILEKRREKLVLSKNNRNSSEKRRYKGKASRISYLPELRRIWQPCDQAMTTGHIFMKISPEMYHRTGKCPLLYGSHLASANLHQHPVTKSTD